MSKVSRRKFIAAAGAVGISLGAGFPVKGFGAGKADMIIHGGPILSIDKNNSVIEAVAVAGDVIVAAGALSEVKKWQGPATKMYDLQGKTLMPGFIDGHSHFPYAGIMEITKVDLNAAPLGDTKSLAQAFEKLKKRADETPAGHWVVGIGLFPDFMDKKIPSRKELDAVSAEHPIVVYHGSGHAVYANSKALEAANITKDSQAPEGGVFGKDEAGELNGTLEGLAQFVLSKFIPEDSRASLLEGCKKSSEMYLSQGVTLAQSMTYDQEEYPLLPLLKDALDKDYIQNRVFFFPRTNAQNYQKVLASFGSSRTGAPLHPSGLLTLGAAKGFSDGSPTARTAYYSKPYTMIPEGKPADFRGFPVHAKENLVKMVTEMHAAGWQIAFHANGDQAIEDMIDAYESAMNAAPRKDSRHILIHAQFTRQDQLDRIRKLGLIPSFYPDCIYYVGDVNNHQLGKERTAFMNPVGPAMKMGIPCTMHSDTPIMPVRPFIWLYSAVNRKTMRGTEIGPENRATVEEALRAATINGAHEYFMEDKLGSLEIGKLADMIVISKNPLDIPVEELMSIKVEKTFVGGKEVYSL